LSLSLSSFQQAQYIFYALVYPCSLHRRHMLVSMRTRILVCTDTNSVGYVFLKSPRHPLVSIHLSPLTIIKKHLRSRTS